MRAVLPQTIPYSLRHRAQCILLCAATRFHRDGGDGRLLAAFVVEHAEEAGQELPQKQRWAPDEQAGFRNNTTTLMRTKDTNEEVKNTDQDTDDSEDLESNISGVVEPQNKILCQIEMNPVKKNLEIHENRREEGGPQEVPHWRAGRPYPAYSWVGRAAE